MSPRVTWILSAANAGLYCGTLVEERKTAFVLVTHDLALAVKMQHQVPSRKTGAEVVNGLFARLRVSLGTYRLI